MSAVIFYSSCESLMDQFGVPVDSGYYEFEMIIPPTGAGEELLIENELPGEVDEILTENNQSGATVKSVVVKEASVRINENSRVSNFNAIESFYITLLTGGVSSDTIASVLNNSEDAVELPMETGEINVAEFLESDEYSLFIHGALAEEIADTLLVTGRVRYEIVLGLEKK